MANCKRNFTFPHSRLDGAMNKLTNPDASDLRKNIKACMICAERFAATHTAHSPRPVVWFQPNARIVIAGQAPGARVHESGRPFTDPSGDRLREWMGIEDAVFYDQDKVAILPMAFCFPGYNDKGADLPPPAICAKTWRGDAVASLGKTRLTLVIGGYAQKWHLPVRKKMSLTENVQRWAELDPSIIPLPHPSWRNTGWMKKNPWFETDLLPVLRARVQLEDER
jgi:uracil-DNA glycosylase